MTDSRHTEGRYPYPFVECDHHPGPQLGYGICVHVMAGAAIGHFEEASETEIGIISCKRAALGHSAKGDMVLACAGCAMEHHAAAIAEWLRKGTDAE